MNEPAGTYFEGKSHRMYMERVLIVEGPDDAYFFDVILADLNADPAKVGIIYIAGKDNLDAEFGSFFKSSPVRAGAVRTYAIAVDADDNPATTIRTVHRILQSHREPTPAAGTFAVHAQTGRRVGLLVLPSPNQAGDLETVCLTTVAGVPLSGRVTQFFTDTIALDGALDHEAKRKAQMFLANKAGELCRGVGRGFVNGHFDRQHPSLQPIRDFCTALIT